jgi:hypothetical protein
VDFGSGTSLVGESNNANPCFDRRRNKEMEYMSSRFYWGLDGFIVLIYAVRRMITDRMCWI